MNGDIEIQLPNGSKEIVSIERLTILNDFIDEFTGMDDGGSEEDYGDEAEEDMRDATGFPYFFNDPDNHQLSVQGRVARYATEDDAWKHLDEATNDSHVSDSERASMEIDDDSMSPSSPLTLSSAPTSPPPFSGSFSLPATIMSISQISGNPEPSDSWSSFVILPSAPKDHAFLTQVPPSQPTKAFLQRLNKEYKVLSSSLPGMSFPHPHFSKYSLNYLILRGYTGSGLRR